MAEKLHNLSEKLPDDNGSASHPSGASAQPPPPPDTTDFGHGPVTGSAQITAMNVDDARQAIQLLRSALLDAEQAQDHGRALMQIRGPGEDPASTGYANSANTNGSNYYQASRQLKENIQNEIANILSAIRQVETTEDQNSRNFRKS